MFVLATMSIVVHRSICQPVTTLKQCNAKLSGVTLHKQKAGMSRKRYDCSLCCYPCAYWDVELSEETSSNLGCVEHIRLREHECVTLCHIHNSFC